MKHQLNYNMPWNSYCLWDGNLVNVPGLGDLAQQFWCSDEFVDGRDDGGELGPACSLRMPTLDHQLVHCLGTVLQHQGG